MPALITLHRVCVSAAGAPLFEDLTLALEDTARVALVGVNGSGKSTLLRLMAGLQTPADGQVVLRKDALVSYVPQFVPPELREMSVYDGILESLRQKRPDLPPWSVEQALHTLAFPTERYTAPFKTLSGGESNQALLARALAVEPDFLLLDEPTNHMDSAAIVRFERFLAEDLHTPFCLVSHDRTLLDHCTEETLFLRDRRLYHFRLPLTPARQALQQHDTAAMARRRHEQHEIARLEESATKLGVWAKQNDKFAGRLHHIRRRIADHTDHLTFVSRERERSLRLDMRTMRANALVRVENLSVTVGGDTTLFVVEELTIAPGDRVAILGRNGAGKTTFVQTLVQAFQSRSNPAVTWHPRVTLGYYDQELRALDACHTPVQHLMQYGVHPVSHLRAELVKAGFPYERHGFPLRTWSGGEQARLQFLALKLLQPTFMILDEPTNHLDVQGIEMLEEDLLASAGTMAFVSHDRRFVQRIANRFLLIHQGRLREVTGLESYYALLAQNEENTRQATKAASPPHPTSEDEPRLSRQPGESVEQAILRLEAVLMAGKLPAQTLQKIARRIMQLYEQL